MAEFVHLHVHSEYSLLDGLNSPRELVARAVELGMPALALTDHGAMYGAVEFYRAAQKVGIKPILGMEPYLARRSRHDRDPNRDRTPFHLLLLVQSETGYHNLLKLATIAQLEGFYYKPRIDKEVLEQHAEGLIVTTGCSSSEISRLVRDGRLDEARRSVAWYRQVFPGRFFLELQDHELAELEKVNRHLLAFAREFDLPLVAANDVHYTRPEEAPIHDILLCIQTNKTVNDPNRMRMDGATYYMRSAEEMVALFDEVPEALTNTLRVTEMCELVLEFGQYHLPPFDVPEGYDAHGYLRHLCEDGLRRRYAIITPEIRARLDYELGVIHQMGFDTYFLIVWDLCRFAREQNIWWNVRGSAASSIVAYALGITNLEPLQHGLIFERFLNPGRITPPDIDLDFPDDQRDRLITYTVEKYGQDRVAQIITFGTMGARAAIRDAGRALDLPLPEVDRIARLVPFGPKVKLNDGLRDVPELREAYQEHEYIRRLIDTARKLEGGVRHASTHAAGVVVADAPLVEYTPLHRPTRGGETGEIGVVTQYAMEELEALGLLKIDFLGLSTLTVMRRACELIRQRHGIVLTLDTIPTQDPAIFELLSRGDVTGVFQVEGSGMRRVLTQMQPTKFEHIVATISLFRPGPMEYIDDYIDRMHGRKLVEYRHPSLEPILRETYATIVYQEQIIRILTDIAGYAPADADLVRRAVGKKKKAELLKHRSSFVKGAVEHGGLPRQTAEAIFDDIEYFARYGFNRAHAADYAVLTCQTAYLKAKYPVEYMAALLSVERHNTEKVGFFIGESRRMGIEVLPPDVNRSDVDFTIEELEDGQPAIRFGLGAIKNVGEGAVASILEARAAGGPFRDLDDFCRRVDLRQVNRRALESLIKVGALRPFGTRSQFLPIVERILSLSAQAHHAREVGQFSLFGETTGVRLRAEDMLMRPLSAVPEVPQREILGWEKELVGVYISEHPLTTVLPGLRDVVTTDTAGLKEERPGQEVVIAGMINRVRRHITRKGDEMAFVGLEDLQGSCDVVVFPSVWAQTKRLWQPDRILVISGRVDESGRDEPKLLCNWVREPGDMAIPVDSPPSLRPSPEGTPRMLEVTIPRTGDQEGDIRRIGEVRALLLSYPGEDRFRFRLEGAAQRAVLLDFPNDSTRYCRELTQRLTQMLGPGSVHVEVSSCQ